MKASGPLTSELVQNAPYGRSDFVKLCENVSGVSSEVSLSVSSSLSLLLCSLHTLLQDKNTWNHAVNVQCYADDTVLYIS